MPRPKKVTAPDNAAATGLAVEHHAPVAADAAKPKKTRAKRGSKMPKVKIKNVKAAYKMRKASEKPTPESRLASSLAFARTAYLAALTEAKKDYDLAVAHLVAEFSAADIAS